MGIRFSDIYSVLDNFEIDFVENQPGREKPVGLFGKAMQISSAKKEYLGRVFHDIYISQLHFRLQNFQGNYHNPVETFNNQVRKCLNDTLNGDDNEEFRAECPLDTLNYQEQFQLLSYQRANEAQSYIEDKNKEKQFVENFNLSPAEKKSGRKSKSTYNQMYFNTIMTHIFLIHAQAPNISGDSLCAKFPDDQLCVEHKQIKEIIA